MSSYKKEKVEFYNMQRIKEFKLTKKQIDNLSHLSFYDTNNPEIKIIKKTFVSLAKK